MFPRDIRNFAIMYGKTISDGFFEVGPIFIFYQTKYALWHMGL